LGVAHDFVSFLCVRKKQIDVYCLSAYSPHAVDSFLDYCRAEARGLIEDYRDVASAIADGLFEHDTLTGIQVQKIIAAAMPRRVLAAARLRRANWAQTCANGAAFNPRPWSATCWHSDVPSIAPVEPSVFVPVTPKSSPRRTPT